MMLLSFSLRHTYFKLHNTINNWIPQTIWLLIISNFEHSPLCIYIFFKCDMTVYVSGAFYF